MAAKTKRVVASYETNLERVAAAADAAEVCSDESPEEPWSMPRAVKEVRARPPPFPPSSSQLFGSLEVTRRPWEWVEPGRKRVLFWEPALSGVRA